jgi:YesN/AraC family two-component response regulator
MKKKILVVEDEAIIALDIKAILDREGYTTLIDCFTVDLAIEMIEAHQPDLVLVDINLNGTKNGLDLAKYLSSRPELPFIFLTSYSDRETLKKVADLSPSAYLTKPYKSQDLISTVFLELIKAGSKCENTATLDHVIPFPITQVKQYIQEHISEKLDLENLAALTLWEPDHFSRMFKKYVGLTPYQFILKSRIELAKDLLKQQEEPSQSICYDVGFTNYSSFFTAFKKFVNMSPEQFRRLTSKKINVYQ